MTVSGYNKQSSWYDSRNIPAGNHNLKTWMYKANSKVSGTEVVTDADIYAKSFLHHIFFEDVMTLTLGETLELKSYCDGFGDDYSFLFFNAFDAQISLLGFQALE